MKTKMILLMLAVILPLSVFTLNADEKQERREIPLRKVLDENYEKNNRSLSHQLVECCYMGMMNLIHTTVLTDLGEITLEVTNTSTGEICSETFDSGVTPQTLLPISGDSGYYTITYTTESGDIYEGTLVL